MLGMRIGYGYDIHRLEDRNSLILGGVEIPFSKGLEGHSDADVLLHAIIDSLLGACVLGDIGHHFPDKDNEYKNINSRILLKKTAQLVKRENYKILNIDSTVVAEQPRLASYILKMRKNIADDLEVEENQISVKATTSEKIGPEGAGKGISARAIALLTIDD